MAITFPTDLDSLSNPLGTDKTDSPSHSGQHSDANDAIEAIEAKVGKDSSEVESSHDYKLSGVTGSDKAASLAAEEIITNKILGAGWSGLPQGGNLLKNGNFINNSTNGYGGTPDDWTNSSGNPVQGGFPSMTKAEFLALTGVADGDLEGLWLLNEASGNALDLSSNSYDLTETSGTIVANDDGLMGTARDFELGDTEYFTLADGDCPNLEISGSQTWFAWIKPESVGTSMEVMSKRTLTDTVNSHFFYITVEGKPRICLKGLTTATSVKSDVILEVGKWYLVVGIYDSVNTKLKIWVNGVKKETTASGSVNDSNTDFAIGCDFAGAGDVAQWYFDGLIQCAGVINGALTDAQVKRLWAATSYRGQKIRRSASNGYIYQDLPQDLVERLRGQTITLRGEMYQDTASIAQISIYDGSETASSTSATTDTWATVSATKTISASATQIQIRAKASTSDGKAWYKELALYEGSNVLPFNHSGDDRTRFPRLLDMDVPQFAGGKPYEYEENRTYSFTPTVTPTGSMTWSTDSDEALSWSYSGNRCDCHYGAVGDVAGTGSYGITYTAPIVSATNPVSSVNNLAGTGTAIQASNGSPVFAVINWEGDYILIRVGSTYNSGNFLLINNNWIRWSVSYFID